jgi:hypothetical protein
MANPTEGWRAYTPSKTVWFWSCIGSVLVTMILGFSIFGWTTAGTAQARADNAVEKARENLVASICVQRFVTAPNAGDELVELKQVDSWKRDDFIEEGGWATIKSLDTQVSGAAETCADRLAGMEGLPARVVNSQAESQG